MPLKPAQIRDILDAKREDFNAFDRDTWKNLERYRAALTEFSELPDKKLAKMLEGMPAEIGARPLESLKDAANGVIPCNLSWQSREQSLNWVRDRLIGISTFAVDGSQIYPGKDVSIPIALVQIGWFENPHLPSGSYNKDIRLDVMTPGELQISHSGEPADRKVNLRRFEMETGRLIEYMREHPNANDCLVFFDGSLVGTFADAFDRDLRQQYVECFLDLLRTSANCRVPLVGYIDTSYARDLTVLLQTLFKLPDVPAIHDAQLLSPFMEWGDRTPLCLCQRSGILSEYEEQRNNIAFTYLKSTRDGYPARIEMPLWMYEAGLLNRVMDWVRGEIIIGSGYPYVIETADQTAVLQAEDRQAFFRILQDWAEASQLNLRFSRKMASKTRRR